MAGLDKPASSHPIEPGPKPEFKFSAPSKSQDNPPKADEVRPRGIELTIEHGVLLMTAVALTLALCIYKGHLGSGDRHA